MHVVLIVALVLPWVLLAAATALLFMFVRQNGRALLGQDALTARLQAIEYQLGAAAGAQQQQQTMPGGLDEGTPAPAFELRDLEGRSHRLEQYAGKPSLVVFWSPTCSFCRDMAARLPAAGGDGAQIVLITAGDLEQNRQMASEHGWAFDILHDSDGKVFAEYRAAGTPTGYLVDDEGNIASALAIGSDALLALLESDGDGHDTDGLQRALNAGLRARDVSHSRIKRDGLEQGTPAPSFTLPDLDGTERTLEEFLDKRLLLVFSDPTCGPCQTLAPQLEALHSRHRDDLNVVMVSRGGIEENDAKAAEHGLTFPVLVQRSWEVSKQYASFGTPVAYLIEPDGVIARDAAQGSDEILKLVAERRRKRAPRSRRRAKAR